MDPYPKQFVIAPRAFQKLPNWEERLLGDMRLANSPSLPVISLRRDSTTVGWILGWFSDGLAFHDRADDVSIDDYKSAREYAQRLAGRFITITCEGGVIGIETDPSGLLPVVFDLKQHLAASSPAVLRLVSEKPADSHVIENVTRHDGKLWFPFGLTPYAGVERLLPNQRLDLTGGSISTAAPMLPTADRGNTQIDTTARVFNRSVTHVRAFSTQGKLDAHLTAGYDSRMILALTVAAGVECHFQTIKTPGTNTTIDCETAKQLSDLVCREHSVIPFLHPSTAEYDAWMDRTGHCVEDTVTSLCRTVQQHDNGRYTLTGTCGEIGRGFYWKKGDLGRLGLTPTLLLQRMGFKDSPLLLRRAEAWLAQFHPESKRSAILDQAYVQLRLPCWAGPSGVGHTVTKPTLTPFNCSDTIHEMLALNEQYRLEQTFARDFISISNASLTHIPFNRASGLKRLRYLNHSVKGLIPESVKGILKRALLIRR